VVARISEAPMGPRGSTFAKAAAVWGRSSARAPSPAVISAPAWFAIRARSIGIPGCTLCTGYGAAEPAARRMASTRSAVLGWVER
jgi:hypothetical protein